MNETPEVRITDAAEIETPTEREAQVSQEAEREKVHERQALSARGVHDTLLLEGADEIKRPWSALAWSGLASGLSMGLSLIAEGVLRTHLPDVQWRPLVAKLGYTVGFLAVTLGRQQLYTETTLTAYLPLAEHRDGDTARNVAKLWIVVLAANMIGAYAFAAAAAHSNAFSPELRESFRQIGTEAANHGFWSAFVKGIFGGWMIALMVWLLPSAEAARIWIIMIVTYLLATAGLTHIIAGSLEVFYLVTTGGLSWGDYLVRFGVPVLAGNSIGGMVFVAALNRAQVSAGTA